MTSIISQIPILIPIAFAWGPIGIILGGFMFAKSIKTKNNMQSMIAMIVIVMSVVLLYYAYTAMQGNLAF